MIGLAAILLVQAETGARFTCANPISQTEMTRCAYEDYHAADRLLNAQWARTLADQRRADRDNFTSMDGLPTYAEAIVKSQRAWIGFRDAQCVLEGLEMRGSGGPMLQGQCLARLTRERTKYLKGLIGN